MGENGGNGSNGRSVSMSLTTVRFAVEMVLIMAALFGAWANLKSDIRDQATRDEMFRQQVEREFAAGKAQVERELDKLTRAQILADQWSRDLDIRLAAAGLTAGRVRQGGGSNGNNNSDEKGN